MRLEERQVHSKCVAWFKELKSHLENLYKFLEVRNTRPFEIAFRIFFHEEHQTFREKMYHNLNQLQWQLERENLHTHDSKTCLDVLKTQFKKFFNSKEVNASDFQNKCWQKNFKDYMRCEPETYKRNLLRFLEELDKKREIQQQESLVIEGTILEANMSTAGTALDASLVTKGTKLEACLVTEGATLEANLVTEGAALETSLVTEGIALDASLVDKQSTVDSNTSDPYPIPISPNLAPPLKRSISKSKRSTRSSSSKPVVSAGLKKFRKVSNRLGKGSKFVVDMNEDESDDRESRDKGADGEVTSNAFFDAQSLDSRSCDESVPEKEVQAGLETDLMGNVGVNYVKGNIISQGISANNSMNINDEIGLIPVPVSKNPLLSSRVSPVVSPRILKRRESLVDGGSKSNAPFLFNNMEKWPSLNRNYSIEVNEVNVGNVSGIRDEVMKEVPVGMKHVSFVNVVQGVNKSGSNKLKLVPMSHREILGHLRRMWRAYQLDEVIMNDCGLYFVKFKSDEDGISMISSMIGSLIIMDRITTEMCDRSYGRASFERVLIKVDADLRLADKIEVWYKSLGKSMELRVEYPWKLPVCSHCKVFGHGLDRCLKRVPNDAEKKLSMGENAQRTTNMEHGDNSDTGWKTVNNRKYGRTEDTSRGMYRQRNYYRAGSSRGGFNGRGRGVMNGRGFGDQRFNKNDGARYVPVKKNEVAGPIRDKEYDKNEKGKTKVNEGKFSRENGNGTGMSSERMNIDEKVVSNTINEKNGGGKYINEGGGSNKENAKKGFDSQNMFSALSDEAEIEKRLEWESIKERIDEKMQELVRKENVADLRLKIKNLENQISHSHKMIEKESKMKANAMVKSVMIEKGLIENQAYRKVYDEVYKYEHDKIEEIIMKKQLAEVELFFKIGQVLSIVEMETWPKEKLRFFKNSIGEEAYEGMVNQIRIESNEDMNEEVAEDSSSVAQFLTQDVVSNVETQLRKKFVDKFDQAMHLSVRSLLDNKLMYVSIIYGEITPKSRYRLWRNLRDHMSIAGSEPWVLLGDFNFMKTHMRDLNRKNEDVFDKVNFLRTELGKVQECLDRDPFNAALREEEMVYASAFKDAALDEEKVLQQKTKITWLKDGDFNSSYFHKVVKGRMSRNRIEDVVYEVKDADSLFTKRLDVDVALDLIKPVDDKEIKEALFSIDDNKASEPDGYSSKFFKAAWSVVGPDLCSATKEFFGNMARNCAFKVDILKAYDNVSWSFLEFCLRKFGFHPIMVNWIMTCLTTTSFSICINWESHGFFKAKRGLSQGDPISPYLFTLVMEVLNLMIKRHVKNDSRFKYHSGCGKLEITSLCFADDLLLLCYGDLISASILRRGLDEFSLSSGLYPSMSKSEAFFCGLTHEIKNNILMAIPFKKGTLFIKYLGVPLVSKKINVNDCKILIKVIQNIINDWKNRNLSFAGKLLISSVLASLQVY
ncbi:RNA-directed DNA polymerase, eukaryota, reverse transcriptase zinc-binding domain protein [Tanacetum coccineum]